MIFIVFLSAIAILFFFIVSISMKNIKNMKILFIIFSIFTIIPLLVLMSSVINLAMDSTLFNMGDGLGYITLMFFFGPMFLISLILYFINFYFLQKTIKDEKVVANWNFYKYVNIATGFSIMFGIVFTLFVENGGFDEVLENIFIIIIASVIIYLPFGKIFRIINSFGKRYS